jgi:hypothetical protein
LEAVDNSSPTSTNAAARRHSDEADLRFEARLAADGRIQHLMELSADGGRRPLLPFSPEGIAALIGGRNIEYRFDDDQRLRDLTYPDVLASLRQEILLTAHKVRHGELLDEPDSLPTLKALLRRIEEAADAFRRAREAPVTDG